jgi:hypothetical protein
VHGTTLTLMNAGRKYLGADSLAGKTYVTAGLGGMSGAQAKAAVIAGCVAVIADVSEVAIDKRHGQGWVEEKVGVKPRQLRIDMDLVHSLFVSALASRPLKWPCPRQLVPSLFARKWRRNESVARLAAFMTTHHCLLHIYMWIHQQVQREAN